MAIVSSKPISIYSNRYVVYPNGKVYSNRKNKFLQATFNKALNDYTYYLTIDENVPKLFFATSLIYNSFHPGEYNRQKHRIVRIDGNKKNLRLNNLKLLSKEEYFNFIANTHYKIGEILYRGELFRDLPGVNFHKISKSGKVLSYVKGKAHYCKPRKAQDGSLLISITTDYKKQKSINPLSIAKKVFKEQDDL